jgi:hypothetical protein
MPRFCLFGSTINTASRMESTAEHGTIHASASTHALVPHEPWTEMQPLEVKGLGAMRTYMLHPDVYLAQQQSWRAKDGGVGGSSLALGLGLQQAAPAAGMAQRSGSATDNGGEASHPDQVTHQGPGRVRRSSVISYSVMQPPAPSDS